MKNVSKKLILLPKKSKDFLWLSIYCGPYGVYPKAFHPKSILDIGWVLSYKDIFMIILYIYALDYIGLGSTLCEVNASPIYFYFLQVYAEERMQFYFHYKEKALQIMKESNSEKESKTEQ